MSDAAADDEAESNSSTCCCKECEKCLPRPSFSKNQWSRRGEPRGSVCIECLEDRQRQQQAGSSKKKRAVNQQAGGSKKSKKAAVEVECASCQKTFAVSNAAAAKKRQNYRSNHHRDRDARGNNGGRNNAGENNKAPPLDCDECEKKLEAKKDHLEYMEHYGVAYEPLNFGDLGDSDEEEDEEEEEKVDDESPQVADPFISKDPIRGEDLLGEYDVIFVESDPRGFSNHYIHRSARGTFKFSMKKWNEEPALCGIWRVDPDFEDDEMNGGMIEAVTENKKYAGVYNGFNIFPSEATSHSKFFVVQRGLVSDGWKWWDDLPTEDDDDSCAAGDRLDEFCGASLSIIGKRTPLALADTDFLPSATGKRVISIKSKGGVSKPESIEEAESMLKRYRDGSNSWMCQHLPGIKAKIAARVREFITPPPILFLEPGDLLVEIEESKECEWRKYFILRKKKGKAS